MKVYLGLSSTHVNQPTIESSSELISMARHYYLSDGYNGSGHCCNSTGGGNYSNGLVGGKGHCCYSDQNQNAGGFGGGGGGGLSGPGGAGGYTGGTVSGYWSSWSTGGGGGGSHYNTNATNVNWTKGGNSSNPAGTYTGDGWVKITAL